MSRTIQRPDQQQVTKQPMVIRHPLGALWEFNRKNHASDPPELQRITFLEAKQEELIRVLHRYMALTMFMAPPGTSHYKETVQELEERTRRLIQYDEPLCINEGSEPQLGDKS